MTVSIEVPEDISFGYVTDHVLLAVGDGDDADDYPDAIAAEGSVTFTPVNPNVAVHGGDATIAIQPITATVRESDGRLTYNGKAGVWLVVGDYKVRWALKGAKITDATIRVTADHTPENPLVLARQVEIKPTPTMKLVVNEELYRRTEGLVEEAQGIVSDLSGTIESEIVRITSEGDYRGPSAYQVAVEEGFEGSQAEWLATLVGPEGAASTVPGPPGAVPTAEDYSLIGPGRPDVPASTGDLVSASTPVGATYTSTDGAGVGAFVWRKRPDGSWEVVDGDTGWRAMATETGRALYFRRKNDMIHWQGTNLGEASSRLLAVPDWAKPNHSAWMRLGAPIYRHGKDSGAMVLAGGNGIALAHPEYLWLNSGAGSDSASAVNLIYSVVRPWPSTLPGTPA